MENFESAGLYEVSNELCSKQGLDSAETADDNYSWLELGSAAIQRHLEEMIKRIKIKIEYCTYRIFCSMNILSRGKKFIKK